MATFYFFSVYFGTTVLMNPELKEKHWKSLEMGRYGALHLAVWDYKRVWSNNNLNLKHKRPTPRQCVSYSTSSIVINILRCGSPQAIKDRQMKTICSNARIPHRPYSSTCLTEKLSVKLCPTVLPQYLNVLTLIGIIQISEMMQQWLYQCLYQSDY